MTNFLDVELDQTARVQIQRHRRSSRTTDAAVLRESLGGRPESGWLRAVPLCMPVGNELMGPVHVCRRFDRADRRDGSTAFGYREAHARTNALQVASFRCAFSSHIPTVSIRDYKFSTMWSHDFRRAAADSICAGLF